MDEHKIGVGIIVGLAVASSIYVKNSNLFTKEQKTILLIFIVFPPAQWIGILFVLAYNKNKENNSAEKVEERKVNEINKKLDTTISNLKDLKEKGILTDEELRSKFEKINAEKAEQHLKSSIEYKQLKSLFETGVLTKEEFENKIQVLQKVFEKKINYGKNNVDEINPSKENIETKNNISLIKNGSGLSKNEKTAIILCSFLIISGIIIVYFQKHKEIRIEKLNTQTKIESTNYIENNSFKDTLKVVDIDSSLFNIEETQTIVFFNDICGIYPGKTSFNEVKLKLGEPDLIDISKKYYDENTGNLIGGHKIVKYISQGIVLLFDRDDSDMSTVIQVLVNQNFKGKSSEGIYIGMPEKECFNILDKLFFIKVEFEGYKEYSKNEGEKQSIRIWIKNGKVDELAID